MEALIVRNVPGSSRQDVHLRRGLNVHAGMITHPAVAEALGLPYLDPLVALDQPQEALASCS